MLPNPLDIKHWAIPRAGWARGPLWTLWLSGRVSLPLLHPYILSPHPFASYLCCVSFQWWLQSSSPLCALSVWYQSELCHRTSSCSHRFVRKFLLLIHLTVNFYMTLTIQSQYRFHCTPGTVQVQSTKAPVLGRGGGSCVACWGVVFWWFFCHFVVFFLSHMVKAMTPDEIPFQSWWRL